VALPRTGYRAVLARAPMFRRAGGRIYDEIIGACLPEGTGDDALDVQCRAFSTRSARVV